MLIKIDEAVSRFKLHSVKDAKGDRRRYYVSDAPDLMIVVIHIDTPLANLKGQIVDVAVGWHEGQYGFVRKGNERQRHSKVTIYNVVPKGLPSKTLTQLLKDAPKEQGERP